MKTFLKWAEANKLELPMLNDTEPSKKTTSESGTRTGVGPQYPDAYVRAQYPHKYFNPTKATADLDLKNAGKKD
jgi:hypothetical protein